jgi:two-component system OmpR family response regulator
MPIPTTAHLLSFPPRCAQKAAPPTRVLLADADDDTRALYLVSLTHAGFRVRSAASAAEAFDIAQCWRPDIVVTELMLPGGGLGLIHRFLTHDATRAARLVVLTTQNATFLRERADDAGVDMYLVKPCGARQLCAALTSPRARFTG